MRSTSHKSKLNEKQIHLLKLVYKFRFVTSSLLAKYKGISISAVNYSLEVLLSLGYLDRRFDKKFKLLGKGACYYLTAQGKNYLREHTEFSHNPLHAIYNNKTVGQIFIDHNIDVFRAFLSLRDSYPGAFHIFTKSELGDYDYFPKPVPDLYLNRIKIVDDRPNEYMLDIFADTQLFIIKKRIALYLEHFRVRGMGE